jgi:predicted transcriptional regulator
MAKGVKGSSPNIEDRPKVTSFNIKPAVTDKIAYISFFSKRSKTDIVEEALTDYIRKYEKKNGEISLK